MGELNPDDGTASGQELGEARQQDRSLTMFGAYYRPDAGSPARLFCTQQPRSSDMTLGSFEFGAARRLRNVSLKRLTRDGAA